MNHKFLKFNIFTVENYINYWSNDLGNFSYYFDITYVFIK
jgi:hypothetical protein